MAGEPLRESYCLQRAAEARAKADAMKDVAARQMMLQVAQMWELMARQAARDDHKQNPERPSSN